MHQLQNFLEASKSEYSRLDALYASKINVKPTFRHKQFFYFLFAPNHYNFVNPCTAGVWLVTRPAGGGGAKAPWYLPN